MLSGKAGQSCDLYSNPAALGNTALRLGVADAVGGGHLRKGDTAKSAVP